MHRFVPLTPIHVVLLALGTSLAASAGAQSQAASPPLSLAQAIEAAWQRSALQAAATGRIRQADAEGIASRSLWAAPPSLESELRQTRSQPSGRSREVELGLNWPLWLPGQRAARSSAAQAEAHASRAALAAARLRVAGEVREAALAVATHRAEAREADLQVRLLAALADDVERRVRAGDLARADAMAAGAEMLSATVLHQEAQARLQATLSAWRLLTGVESVPEAQPSGPPSATVPPDHPELAAAAAAVESARRRLHAVERSRREPPELGVRVRREDDAAGGRDSGIGVSLRVPFATADRNAPMIAAARTELEVAESEERRLRDRLESDMGAAREALRFAAEQLQAERARAVLLRQRAELVEKSFRAGESGLPDTLRALALAAQADTAVVRRQATHQLAQARLIQLVGRQP